MDVSDELAQIFARHEERLLRGPTGGMGGSTPRQQLRERLTRAGVPAEQVADVLRLPPPAELDHGVEPPMRLTEALRGVGVCLGASWVFVLGAMGRGKSTAAAYWLAAHSHGLWVQSEEIAALPVDPQWANVELQRWIRTPALVIDDLGVRDGQRGVLAPMVQRVLTARYPAGRPTCLTSNLAPAERLRAKAQRRLAAEVQPRERTVSLEEYLGDRRLANRLAHRSRLVTAGGPNLRAELGAVSADGDLMAT